MEHVPTPAEVQFRRSTAAALEVVGSSSLFSPHLGPVITPADFRIVAASAAVAKEQRRENEPSPALLCHYSGKFFCSNCHWGDVWCIPGKVFALGVTTPYPVSAKIV